jgi:predicted Rossmann fold nucleotide-binding protein DprA/Smf involved in DNA uptake
MLTEGGSVCRGVDDVLVAMRVKERNSSSSKCTDHRRIPTTDGAAVLSGLGWDVLPVDRLLARFPGTSPGTLLLVLHELEFDGWVARGADGWFQLAAGQGR